VDVATTTNQPNMDVDEVVEGVGANMRALALGMPTAQLKGWKRCPVTFPTLVLCNRTVERYIRRTYPDAQLSATAFFRSFQEVWCHMTKFPGVTAGAPLDPRLTVVVGTSNVDDNVALDVLRRVQAPHSDNDNCLEKIEIHTDLPKIFPPLTADSVAALISSDPGVRARFVGECARSLWRILTEFFGDDGAEIIMKKGDEHDVLLRMLRTATKDSPPAPRRSPRGGGGAARPASPRVVVESISVSSSDGAISDSSSG